MALVRMGRMIWAAAAIAGLMAGPARADSLPQPEGPVVLTVTGAIAQTNGTEAAEFDLAMLEALGPVVIRTGTIWTEGVQVFRGVPLLRVVEAVQAQGDVITAAALNDYSVDIPLSDAVDGGPILAFEQNGKPLSERDKGPLWVVYPYDGVAAYQAQVIYARSIWQVKRLEIR